MKTLLDCCRQIAIRPYLAMKRNSKLLIRHENLLVLIRDFWGTLYNSNSNNNIPIKNRPIASVSRTKTTIISLRHAVRQYMRVTPRTPWFSWAGGRAVDRRLICFCFSGARLRWPFILISHKARTTRNMCAPYTILRT